jgi:ribonucleotide reductase alpha subunit
MRVIKRNGEFENVSFDKVLNRLKYLSDDIKIDICEIAQKVCSRIYDGVSTSDLDELAAHLCSSLVVLHPDYGRLASKIIISNHHKNTSPSFSETIHILFHNPTGPLIARDLYETVQHNKEKLNSYIDYSRDYCFDYFGFKTLERSYLLKSGGKTVERPQHMWMRVSLGIHNKDIKEALHTYDLMSQKYFTHATPTLFNSGTPRPQNSSCFLLSMRNDSISGIYDSLKDVALISKYAGGIGIHMHQIRAKGSVIRGNNGISSGIVPMLRVFNNTARYVDQAGKRMGSIAVYMEPHHADIEQFLELRKNHGNEEERCRDLFLALWVPDLFMERVRDNAVWSLMCPDQCPELSDVWGEEFNKLYTSYEERGRYVKQVNAQDLWFKILESQIETGVPYICYKDHANRKSNQQNLGTIKSSNLCVAPETMILTDEGYFPIKELKDKEVRVWNGHDFSETVVMQTGTQQKLMKVFFSNGTELRCTPYHKFYLKHQKSFVVSGPIEAKDLSTGDILIDYKLPTIREGSTNVFEKAFEKTDYVPLNSSLGTKLGWLEGCLSVVGSIDDNSIEAVFTDKEFALHTFYMIQTLGVHPVLIQGNDTSTIRIYEKGVWHLRSLGFSPKNLDLTTIIHATPNETDGVRVVKTIHLDETDDTYCFNEPHRHMGVFNGVLTGNCTEIMEVSTPDEISVCNLASICLPTYIEDGVFNFEKLHHTAKVITKNLNKVIDCNFYPLEEARRSNLKHRPVGLGIQGLSDVFMILRMPFESDDAKELNKNIFETIYHGALESSMEISRKRHLSIHNNVPLEMMNEYEPLFTTSKYPGAYSSFDGSPVSKGILQYDMWGVVPSSRYDWQELKEQIKIYGIRNSLLLAPMPTASTAQIMGFNESFEPVTSNIFKRKTLSGEFIVVNKYLIKDLIDLGLWSNEMKDRILLNDGSVQDIDEIPPELKELYKTVWEIKQKTLIDMSADRGAFICQSQSLNIFIEDPDYKKLTSMHFYGWSKGLKTGSYYIRTKPKAKTQQFTIDPNFAKKQQQQQQEKKSNIVCTDEVCTMCSS